MKVSFKKIISAPSSDLIIYSPLNPIPFSLKLIGSEILPETIYARNLAGENFIEFRFHKATKQLYEITVVAIQEGTVKSGINGNLNYDNFYECYIDDKSELDISNPVQILRSDSELYFYWRNQPLKTYAISKNCILSIDNDNNLCALSLVNLNKESIYEILGF